MTQRNPRPARRRRATGSRGEVLHDVADDASSLSCSRSSDPPRQVQCCRRNAARWTRSSRQIAACGSGGVAMTLSEAPAALARKTGTKHPSAVSHHPFALGAIAGGKARTFSPSRNWAETSANQRDNPSPRLGSRKRPKRIPCCRQGCAQTGSTSADGAQAKRQRRSGEVRSPNRRTKAMPRFCVTFRKIVYGSTGHARTICQRIIEVEARDVDAAQTTATERFCGLEKVGNWLDHADWVEIALADPPPAARAATADRDIVRNESLCRGTTASHSSVQSATIGTLGRF